MRLGVRLEMDDRHGSYSTIIGDSSEGISGVKSSSRGLTGKIKRV